jgi:hypothetical protein
MRSMPYLIQHPSGVFYAQRKVPNRLQVSAARVTKSTLPRLVFLKGPAQPSPPLGDALNAGYRFRFMRTRLASADAAEEIACAGAAGR